MAVNVKLGVDLSSFNSGIREGQSILKGLNAEMKATEAEFKATGNAEKALEQKTKTLNRQLNVQKGIIDKAEKALKAMRDEGVEPTDTAYQKMYATLMNATAGMNETQAALNNLTASEQTAAAGANNLTDSVNSIGKKISLDQVISGINSITSGLENAAKKAVSLGESIWNSIIDSAAWSDDVDTLAERLGLTVEEIQKMKVVAAEFEAPVETVAKTWKKVKMNMTSDSNEVVEAFKELGITTKEWGEQSGQSGPALVAKNYKDVFWEIGDAIMRVTDEAKQERLAEKLLGRSWDELASLFKKGREAYESAMDKVSTTDEETINNNAALADSVKALEEQFNIFKADVLGNISPQLQKVTNSFGGLLTAITDYINTPQGQELLSGIGDAIGDLVDDIANIDPKAVVDGFVSVINSLVNGLRWIVENKEGLKNALIGVVGAWGSMRIGGSILTIIKMIDGLRGLGFLGGGSGAADAASEASSGGNWLSGVMSGIGRKMPAMTSWMSVNGGPVLDWLTHESPLGTIFQGVESIGDWWSRMLKEQQERTDTFGDNWNPNSADANVIMKNAGNTIRFWDDFWSQVFTGGTGWNWGPQQEGTGSDWTDEEAQNLADAIAKRTEEMEGVTVDVEPEAPIDSAQKISEQIGTVQVPVQLLMRGGGSGMVPFPIEGFHANGLPFVPFDNYLALLHRGERVMPAREVASRNFSSNLYVENMNMNGGLSADALAAAIAGRNRRMMAGYGS